MATSTTVKASSGPIVTPRVPKYRASCDNCHSLKVRCGQEKPNCFRCENNGVPCVYGISRRMGKPKGGGTKATGGSKAIGGSKATGGSAKPAKRQSVSLSSERKRQAVSSAAAIHARSTFNAVQKSQPADGTFGLTPAEQSAALSLLSPSSTYIPWHEHPWNISPHTTFPFYPHSALDGPMETIYPPTSWMGNVPIPIDPNYPSRSNSSRSSPPSDLDLDAGNHNTDQLLEDITSWWDYCSTTGMVSSMTPISDTLGSSSSLPEIPLLTPTSSMFGPTQLATPSNHCFSIGEPHDLYATQCNHYLSLLQNLATIEKVLHSSHPHSAAPADSPTLKATHPTQPPSKQTHPRSSKRPSLDLSFDQILALAKETLRQSSDVLKCDACLANSSCLLLFAVLSEKVVGLYQAGAGAYGIHTDTTGGSALGELAPHFARDHHAVGLPAAGAATAYVAACQTSKICVGKHELEPVEERALVKNLVKSRLKEMADVLNRLRSAVGNLPGDGGQASACRNALGHAWGKLGFVSGLVE